MLASGATAIAGFAVLIVSDIRMLRDFGEVTVIDLTVSLLGVLVVLPAVLVLAERRAAGEPVPAAGLRRACRACALRRAGGLRAVSGRGPLDFEHESRRGARGALGQAARPGSRPARRVARSARVGDPGPATARREPLPLVPRRRRSCCCSGRSRSTRCATKAAAARGGPVGSSRCRRSRRRWRSARFADDADVNVARKAGQGRAGKVPACSVTDPGVLNVCRLSRAGPVVLVFFATQRQRVHRQLDVVQRVRAQFPGVQLRGDRDPRRPRRPRGSCAPRLDASRSAYDRDGVAGQPLRRRGLPAADVHPPRRPRGPTRRSGLRAARRELTRREPRAGRT